jgi:hypothetical protein
MASNAEDAAAQIGAPTEEPRYAEFTRFEIELEVNFRGLSHNYMFIYKD